MFKKTQEIFKITEMLTSMWNFMGKKALHIFMCTVFKCPWEKQENRQTACGQNKACVHACVQAQSDAGKSV